jgi:hypothetical protein
MEAPKLPIHSALSVTDLFIIWQRKRPRHITITDFLAFLFKDIPEHENNTAAIAAGLTDGQFYNLPYDAASDSYKVAIVRSSYLITEDGDAITTEDDKKIFT